MTAVMPPEFALRRSAAHWGVAPSALRCQAVAGDASSRRYFRLSSGAGTRMLVHAPPGTEKNDAFLAVRQLLETAGVRVPALFDADPDAGYLLLEDLGDQLLLQVLDEESVDAWYRRAGSLLQQLARVRVPQGTVSAYDRALLGEELGRFPHWFASQLLQCEPSAAGRAAIAGLDQLLLDSALAQPRVLVHRDFHSRNLMLLPDGELALIDFQDAVLGPVSYDLVSLLRDCYIRWPRQRVRQWALQHKRALQEQGLLGPVDDAEFLRAFDWMGLQRHIKVLGTFARLYLRDGKAIYLADLPLVIRYVREVLADWSASEAACADFLQWFDSDLGPAIAAQGWSA